MWGRGAEPSNHWERLGWGLGRIPKISKFWGDKERAFEGFLEGERREQRPGLG